MDGRIEQRPDEYGDSMDVYFVAPDGSEHELWWDGCNRDCPEDLIWARAIGQLFQVAFALGARYGRELTSQSNTSANECTAHDAERRAL